MPAQPCVHYAFMRDAVPAAHCLRFPAPLCTSTVLLLFLCDYYTKQITKFELRSRAVYVYRRPSYQAKNNSIKRGPSCGRAGVHCLVRGRCS